MKTPYDTAARASRRTLDDLRLDVARAADEVDLLVSAQRSIATEMKDQAAFVGGDSLHFIDYGAYAHRKRQEARAVASAEATARVQLDQLTDRVREAFGEVKAIDTASDNWRARQLAEIERKEQAVTDDLAAQAFRRSQAA